MGRSRTLTAWLALLAVMGPVCPRAAADEGGVSFWLPGTFGSLAATPQQPGWSFASIFYATSVSAGRDVSRAREFRVGRVPVGADVNANLHLDADGELGLVIPSYVFATPILGGQAAVSLMGIYGRSGTSIAGTLDGVLTTPGGPIPFTRSGSRRRYGMGLRRPVPADFAQVEQGGAQLHDLCHRRRAGRRL